MNKAFLFTILLITIFDLSFGQSSRSVNTGILNVTACSSSQFFDTTLLNCNSCPTNEISAGNQTICACQTGTIINSPNVIGFKANCTSCPTVRG